MTQLLSNPEPVKPEQIQEDIHDPDLIVDELDISHLVIEDDKPVDNFQSAQQQRLLVDALCSSKVIPAPFLAEANVGLFYTLKGDPIVPDMLLSLGVQRANDFSDRRNRSYFVWELGKVPDVCIEIISNREGDEISLSSKSRQKGRIRTKKDIYSHIGVPFYVVFDPLQQLQGETEMNGALVRVWTMVSGRQVELTDRLGLQQQGQWIWLEAIGLGLTLWEGCFEEDIPRRWLRWCDRQGQVIPTGAEGMEIQRQSAEAEKQRAEAEKQRADRLAERLRALGINPDEET